VFDRLIRNARLQGGVVDIGIASGKIAAIGPGLPSDAPVYDAGGKLVCAGLIETHIHLDKSRLLDRCPCGASVADAIRSVAQAKRDFTEDDVYERARATLERCVLHGTTRMRTHVEVDPRVGLTSVRALLQLKRDYAWAIDLQLCAFPQEGLLDDPGCDAVLVAALEAGCDLVGGVPYVDRDPAAQIRRIFELAQRFDVDIDFHLDNTLDGDGLDVLEVCRLADRAGWGGRVAVGHMTKLSALEPARFDEIARVMANSGVSVAVLPATDLYMMGRGVTANVPRGVAPAHGLRERGVLCSLSTNNVLNPFTPYGDGSLLRIANLFANVAQLGAADEMAACFDMVTSAPAAVMRLDDYGIEVGAAADLVLFDAASPAQAVAEIAPALAGWKRGRPTFERPVPRLLG
jgi:cytosine deaminase